MHTVNRPDCEEGIGKKVAGILFVNNRASLEH